MSPLLPLAEGLGLALAVLLLGDWLYLLFPRPGNSLPRWFAGWRQDPASLPLLVLALALMLMVIALLGFGVAKAVRLLLGRVARCRCCAAWWTAWCSRWRWACAR